MSRGAKDYVESSGNVFADLGVPNPDEALVKAQLAAEITALIQRRRLTQTQAAKLLRIDQPKISALRRGRLAGFSLERLMRFLLLLGHDIDIVISRGPGSRSRPRLRVA
jgi:predicted XRE-type DNA-binding protein